MATEPRGAATADGARNPTRGELPGFDGETPPPAPAPRAARFVSTTVEVEGREEQKIVELPAFEPEPWGADADLRHVGARLPRVDALEKVTGRARYTADVQRPGMLHAAILRAPLPRGRVVHLDLAPALALPGVRAAVAAADVPAGFAKAGVRLFSPEVTYAGQPVAALCADAVDAARRALDAIVVEYEALPFAATFDAAVAPGAPAVRPRGGNTAPRSPRVASRGDVERGLREAAVVVERVYRTPVALHTALEPHGAVAEWDGGRLTLWESTQGIFNTRDDVAGAFGLPHTAVRVIKDYMGGGFGAKNGASTNAFVAALLARRAGRPVRCINDREGEQVDSGNRPATVQRVRLGATRDGRLTAIDLVADVPLGVSGWQAGPGKFYHQMYSCPNVRTAETFAWVNAGAMSSFRAPGHVEGAFGLERAMDVLARELSLDPLELRLRNFAERDEEKDRPYSANGLRECYRDAAARFGWRQAERGARSVEGAPHAAGPLPPRSALHARSTGAHERTARGHGVAAQVWNAGGGPPAYAIVKLNSDGTADVLTGTQDLGTGSRTILTQVAAESLGAAPDGVRVVIGDTERTPYTGNSWGSMTTPSVAPAVRMAAEDARRQLLEAAAQMLDVAPDQLDARDGVVTVRGTERTMTFPAIAEQLGDVMIIGRGSRGPNPERTGIATFGVQFAEVEVDAETGVVRVTRIVAVHDAGRIVNPTLAESQLEGGILQGLGYALFEERVLDPRLGLPLNPTMHDYKVPTLSDLPAIDARCIAGADPSNHTGARGLAEAPIIPTAPAIANAVADALGVEVNEIPLTPWRVLGAVERKV